jgi:hypothetical protein
MTPVAPGVFARVRDSRASVVWFFVVLTALVAGERRLSEFHFNLRTAETGIESDDLVDGDEIRVRLTVLNDDSPPTVSDVGRSVSYGAIHASPQRLELRTLGRPAPRGPPPHVLLAAS